VAQSFGNLTKGIIGTLVLAKGKSMFKKLIGLLRDEAAATAIEYALIAALVSGCRRYSLEHSGQQPHGYVLDRCKETLGHRAEAYHHSAVVVAFISRIHSRSAASASSIMDTAAYTLPVLYASPAATCRSQIAAIPLCASILDAMPSGKLSSRIIAPSLRGSKLI
jgi:hypothetical protein